MKIGIFSEKTVTQDMLLDLLPEGVTELYFREEIEPDGALCRYLADQEIRMIFAAPDRRSPADCALVERDLFICGECDRIIAFLDEDSECSAEILTACARLHKPLMIYFANR